MTITNAGTLEYIDPTTLVVETNVRTSAALTKEFIEDIRQHGIQQPVRAWRDASGTVHVRAGQRRTSAALELGMPTIPVFILDNDDQDETTRIIAQLNENEHRAELTNPDRIAAWHQLEMDGLNVATIAKRTGIAKERVRHGLALAKSDTGQKLVQDTALTLDQAAALLEFEDDDATVASLTETAITDPNYFPHAAQRARDERAARAARDTAMAEEEAKGHTVLDPNNYDVPGYALNAIKTTDGGRVTPDDVQGKNGVLVRIQAYRGHDSEEITAHLTYYVADPAAHGYIVAPGYEKNVTSGPMTDEQKAERKTLIANNKAWEAAQIVRREWLAALLSRKAVPKNAARVIASGLTFQRRNTSQAMSQGNQLAAKLLGLETSYQHDVLAAYLDKQPARAAHVSLAVVLGGIEDSTTRESWRTPNKEHAAYLATLAEWGYTLSPVERIAALLPAEA